jgi:predicted nucleic acid-binding protein
MIAAIVMRHQSVLATRNVRDFAVLGLKVVNPWE